MGRRCSGGQGLGTAGGVSVAMRKDHQPYSFCPGWRDLVWSRESSSGEGCGKWGEARVTRCLDPPRKEGLEDDSSARVLVP